MKLRQLRLGELAALIGAALVIVATFLRNYEGPSGTLDAWQTFGPAVVLLVLAACAGLATALAAVGARTSSLPVVTAVWTVLIGLIGVVAAVVRVLEHPDHATRVCAGCWIALAGAVLVFAGAWQAIRDERQALYPPVRPQPRARP